MERRSTAGSVITRNRDSVNFSVRFALKHITDKASADRGCLESLLIQVEFRQQHLRTGCDLIPTILIGIVDRTEVHVDTVMACPLRGIGEICGLRIKG